MSQNGAQSTSDLIPGSFDNCNEKLKCCGGDNDGFIYESAKPCALGFSFDPDTCTCVEDCSNDWEYRWHIRAFMKDYFITGPQQLPDGGFVCVTDEISLNAPLEQVVSGRNIPQLSSINQGRYTQPGAGNPCGQCYDWTDGFPYASMCLAGRASCPTPEDPAGSFYGQRCWQKINPVQGCAVVSDPWPSGSIDWEIIKVEVVYPPSSGNTVEINFSQYPLPPNWTP